MACVDHLNFCNSTCPDCGEPVDGYGNTADDFRYCSFPDCGCDGARLCMAKEGPSDTAHTINVEGMWGTSSGKAGVAARLALVALVNKTDKESTNG